MNSQEEIDRATEAGDLDALLPLLIQGARPSVKRINRAAGNGHTEVIEILAEFELFPSPIGIDWAITGCHQQIIELLIGRVDPTEEGVDLAAEIGHLGILELLTDHGYHPTAQGLTWAIRQGHIHIVKYLLENGLRPAKEEIDQVYALSRHPMAKLFWDAGLTPSALGVQLSFYTGDLETVRLLLEENHVPTEETINKAVCRGDMELLELLIEHQHCPSTTLLKQLSDKPQYQLIVDYLTSKGIY